jgi:3-phenylpropionate/trans-cinnamate dioxygenase ferredoxin component
MAKWIKVLELNGIQNGMLVRVTAEEDELCIGMVEGKPFAVDNVCSHQEYPLHDGQITEDGFVRCRYHGAKFNPFNGEAKAMPATYPLYTHPAEIRPDGVYVFI